VSVSVAQTTRTDESDDILCLLFSRGWPVSEQMWKSLNDMLEKWEKRTAKEGL